MSNTFNIGDKVTVNKTGARRHEQCIKDCTLGKAYEVLMVLPESVAAEIGVIIKDDVGDTVGLLAADVTLA